MSPHDDPGAAVSSSLLVEGQKRIRGALFGDSNPLYDIPRLLGLHRDGRLLLEELVSRRYQLDQVNDGYADLAAGRNLRGVVVHHTG